MILSRRIVIRPLEKRSLTVRIPQGWTLDSVSFCGPDSADDWQAVMVHQDGVYRVTEDRPKESKRVYEGRSLDAAVEHYLVAVRRLTMEAMGVAYKPLVIEPGDE
jgi:hypothetical protein